MKTQMTFSVLALIFCFLAASVSSGQPWRGWRGSGGWGMGSRYQRMYNPATMETVAGEIVKIEREIPFHGMSYGIHLLVKTTQGTIPVHLGPEWFIERLDMKLSVGDAVEVKGSRVTFEGKPAIIAAEIKKGDSVIVLRNSAGIPVWAGRGARMR
ncbi:MAG: DNA-binding protein [Deltaproteobacteria bacterium]|jgi:hypothetical protein